MCMHAHVCACVWGHPPMSPDAPHTPAPSPEPQGAQNKKIVTMYVLVTWLYLKSCLCRTGFGWLTLKTRLIYIVCFHGEKKINLSELNK